MVDARQLQTCLFEMGVMEEEDCVAVTGVEKFEYGQSNPTFKVWMEKRQRQGESRRTHAIVVRKQPGGKLLKSAHDMDREYRILRALYPHYPVAKPLGYHSRREDLDGTFYAMQYIDGVVFTDPTLPDLTSTQRKHVYTQLIDALSSLHALSPASIGLADLSPHSGFETRQIRRWYKQYQLSVDAPSSDMEWMHDWLEESKAAILGSHLHASLPTTLVHGDFRLDNAIFERGTYTLKGVLDWELASLGNPLADLGYFLMAYYLTEECGPLHTELCSQATLPAGIPSPAEVVSMYMTEARRKGVIPSTFALSDLHLRFFIGLAFFRASSILFGVSRRSQQRNASAGDMAEIMGDLAHHIASAGRRFVSSSSSSSLHLAEVEKERAIPTHTHTHTHAHSHTSAESGGGEVKAATSNETGNGGEKEGEKYEDVTLPAMISSKMSKKARNMLAKITWYVRERVIPNEKELLDSDGAYPKWTLHPLYLKMEKECREGGMWNLFITKEMDKKGEYGKGLTNAEYATMAEVMGSSLIASSLFNCQAPDTGNMEVLIRYGNDKQKARFLPPLLCGEEKSCFAMTEPDVASSDATNMEATIKREGDEYVINGKKWWVSGAYDPRCRLCLFLGRQVELSGQPAHLQHSVVLIPMPCPGLKLVRPLLVMGFDDSPHGHAEMRFDNVRVPVSHMVLGEGKAFEIAQGRLGPGRLHHCLRLVGLAKRSLDKMCERSLVRSTFKKRLAEHGMVHDSIAMSEVDVENMRLICFAAALELDEKGNKAAKDLIGKAKIFVPSAAQRVIDRAIQVYGGAGMSDEDSGLAHAWAAARALRIADGPDEVHKLSLARSLLKRALAAKL